MVRDKKLVIEFPKFPLEDFASVYKDLKDLYDEISNYAPQEGIFGLPDNENEIWITLLNGLKNYINMED